MVTHTAPDFCEKRSKSGLTEWAKLDPHLLNDIALERLSMTSLYDELVENGHILRRWFYGHFHANCYQCHENVCFVMLNIHENRNLSNTC